MISKNYFCVILTSSQDTEYCEMKDDCSSLTCGATEMTFNFKKELFWSTNYDFTSEVKPEIDDSDRYEATVPLGGPVRVLELIKKDSNTLDKINQI